MHVLLIVVLACLVTKFVVIQLPYQVMDLTQIEFIKQTKAHLLVAS